MPGLNVRHLTEESMAKHTTFRTGGPAEIFALPKNVGEIIEILNYCSENGKRYYLLGDGANVLVPDEGLRGAVICTAEMNGVTVTGDVITAEAGAKLAAVSALARRAGLGGLEFACGIPGTVGGALYMNAGAYGGEINDVCVKAEVLATDENGEYKIKELARDALRFSYRGSVFQHEPLIALKAVFKLTRGDTAVIRARMDELLKKRRESQPLEYPSAGSAFKRPDIPGVYAAKLIEDSGLKGCTIGGAQVSGKHAGFIINKGGATSADILRLIGHVRETVNERFGILLNPEIERLS
jgi:UDP-N-acetylmuramate dehydrogenase